MKSYFHVRLAGGSPWGFRIQGGRQARQPIRISSLTREGKAALRGIREGDVLDAINGRSIVSLTQAEAHQLIQTTGDTLNLTLRREENFPAKSMFKSSTTIELNEENKATPITDNTLPTSTNSTETCSTTIVVNTSRKPSPRRNNGTDNPSLGSMTTTKLAAQSDQRSLTGVPAGPTFKATGPKAVWMPGRSPHNTMETNQRKAHDQERFDESSAPSPQPQLRSVRLNISEDAQKKNPKAEETYQKYFTPEETFAWKASQNPQSFLSNVSSSASQENYPSMEKNSQNPFPLTNKSELQIGSSDQLHFFQDPAGISYNKPTGHIPRGAIYIDHKLNSKEEELPKDAVLIDQKVIVEGDKIHTDSYYGIPTREVTSTTVNIKAPSKYEFIGPLEKGIPVGLRTNVKKEHASDWYKSMFRSLHKPEEPNRDDFITMRYRKRKGQASHAGGYMSEPEFDREDEYSNQSKYATLDYRRHPVREINLGSKSRTLPHATNQTNPYLPPPSPKSSTEIYKNQPRSIAEYEPGHSSLAERETKLEEDSTPVQLASQYLSPQNKPKPLNYYTDGYESDSTLVRKMGKYPSLGTRQQRNWYQDFPKKASPKERYHDSSHNFQNLVVGQSSKPVKTTFEDDELKKRQEEEKQKKLVTEIEMRRHTDNFMPSQKSPIPLDRYDNPYEPQATPPPKTPEVRNMAKVLYNFTAQTPRELSLNKGDIVYVTKEIDKNWYQGEHHGMIGIFPIKYVEIIPPENAHLQPRKATEGEARAKYNFRAQTSVELSVFKGETVILTGKVDQNWYEGRIGNKKGIVPSAYLEVLREPEEMHSVSVSPKSPRPPASPVYVPVTNSTVSSCQTPNYPICKTRYLETQAASLPKKLPTSPTSQFSLEETKQPVMESLHINTFSEPIPYRALYSYKPQHEDELELNEGDTIYVMEKCDDGWYVGTSLRTGLFGTFPGNYVERI